MIEGIICERKRPNQLLVINTIFNWLNNHHDLSLSLSLSLSLFALNQESHGPNAENERNQVNYLLL
jgi:hypothetical protein